MASFREALARVKTTCVEAFSHPDIPFELLVEYLQPPRNTAYTPVFQAMFVLNEQPSQRGLFADLALRELPLEAGTSTFDLTFTVLQNERQLGVAIEYSTDLFEAASMERLFDSFRALLSDALARPEAPLERLSLLSPEARAGLLEGRRPRVESISADATVSSRFEAQATRTPGRTAVVAVDRSLTYGSCLRRPGRSRRTCARSEWGAGIGSGVCLERDEPPAYSAARGAEGWGELCPARSRTSHASGSS